MVLRDDPDEPRFVQTVTGKGYRFIAPLEKVGEGPDSSLPASPNVHEDEPATGDIASEPATMAPDEILPQIRTEAVSETGRQHSSRRRLWIAGLATAAALVLALVIAGKVHAHNSHASADATIRPEIRSLAVLPLDNLSGDPSQNYFADGMTDELITMLAKNSTLRVVSRTSVMQYKGAHRPLREIAEALGVQGILEGSVERTDGKVHMTIQLIHAPTDTHLWADSYDREGDDVVTLPTEAAEAIAKRLNSSVPVKPARYVNPEAHDAYLRGHYFWMVGRNEDAGKYFQQAVQIQPDYAPGWAGLGEYYGVGALWGSLNPLEASPKAESVSRRAVDLDDSSPQAHTVLGGSIFFNRWDGAQALNELTRATELDPLYAPAYHLRAKILCALGRNDEAITIQKQATAIDPIGHPGAMAENYLCARKFDAAIADGRFRLENFPTASDVLAYLADSYHWKGMDKDAVEMRARELTAEGNPQLAAAVRRAFQSGGYTAVVRCELAELEKEARTRRISTVFLARLHAMLGDHDKTIALLERALEEREPLLLWIQTDPAYDFLHTDERYRSLIGRIGLPPAW
jgi:TolB-like protein